jgi:dTDP-4-dehydrorhamnose 3,5-epimerase
MAVGLEDVDLRPLEDHSDERGTFRELFTAPQYQRQFVQANHSRSVRGVLRGLHYHRYQDDLWYVVSGTAQVALVDLRTRAVPPVTKTLLLSDQHPATLFIPAGVAHGFLALSDLYLIYLVTQLYDPSDEHGIAWNDPHLAIAWQTRAPILSDRDSTNPPFSWEHVPAFS